MKLSFYKNDGWAFVFPTIVLGKGWAIIAFMVWNIELNWSKV